MLLRASHMQICATSSCPCTDLNFGPIGGSIYIKDCILYTVNKSKTPSVVLASRIYLP